MRIMHQLWILALGVGLAQSPPVNPNNPGGSQVKPSTSAKTAKHPAHAGSSSPSGHSSPTTVASLPAGASAHTGSHTLGGAHGSRLTLASGNAITRQRDGRVSDVYLAKRGMEIHHGFTGGLRVSVEGSDHSRIVVERGGHGFVERPYTYGGFTLSRRTYYYHGRAHDSFYQHDYYRGERLSVYVPAAYFRPEFYGWAYNPWPAPVPFSWGWQGPWYDYYRGYFVPYPVYSSPAFWLTDYLISKSLQAAYEERGADSAGISPTAALMPDVKQSIAEEVKGQLALENYEAQHTLQGEPLDPASSGVPRLLSDGRSHVFVAGTDLDLVDELGRDCVISYGDVLQLKNAPPAGSTTAQLVILASKGTPDCSVTSTVSVEVSDLQEMQNYMRSTIDMGLQELHDKQGSGGLPAASASAQATPVRSVAAAHAPPAEKDEQEALNRQLTEGMQAEKEVAAEAANEGSGTSASAAAPSTAAPVSIALGQTIDQVTAVLGQPLTIVDLGAKKIYRYQGMKITFKAGKVSDVE